jgi:TBC1 domain family protein 5
MRELATALPAWEQLSEYSSLKDLKHALFEAEEELPVVTGLRSLCWKVSSPMPVLQLLIYLPPTSNVQIFLLFQNLDHKSWPALLSNSRSAYDSLRARYLRAIENPDEVGSAVDPLSTDEEVWYTFQSFTAEISDQTLSLESHPGPLSAPTKPCDRRYFKM